MCVENVAAWLVVGKCTQFITRVRQQEILLRTEIEVVKYPETCPAVAFVIVSRSSGAVDFTGRN